MLDPRSTRLAVSPVGPAEGDATDSSMQLLVPILLALVLLGLSGPSGPKQTGPSTPRQGESSVAPMSLATVRANVEQAAASTGALDTLHIEPAMGALRIDLDAAALFRSGSAEILPAAVRALDAVGSTLANVGNEIQVEGHSDTDAVAPGSPFADNWALSSARAAAVVRYLHQFHGIVYRRLSLSAFADSRPIASNATALGKARNRRVTVVVLGG